ncbi:MULTISPECIES: hypothetical protein [Enterobacter]|nr:MULTISPECIES: hypothetical protein [Enterobacter]KAA0526783.1 hypothetical protein F0321_10490 [Enterobacter asburiae]KAA0530318.1 hypothetical protein F0320_18225 [Enterobacter dykesii]MCV3773418.1 hypothetical protein [Enterobacter sp. RD4-1-1]RTN77028.1 hypothetical protein EKN81_17970 [Enterobacter asburiae]RTP75568.1 hypothetical protein EKN32_17970 [Enterobacter asburiae]
MYDQHRAALKYMASLGVDFLPIARVIKGLRRRICSRLPDHCNRYMMINPRLKLFLLLVLLWMSGLFITMAAGRLLIAAASYLFLNDFDFKWSDLITALKISVGAGFIIGGGQSLQVKEKK